MNEPLLPPQSFFGILRQIGPGIILTGSIVGSGELIAVPTLGARVGYGALWIILLSCLIKPIVQAELARYCLIHNKTSLAALNLIPGPKWHVSWVVWAWALMVLLTQLQVGAMYAGCSLVLQKFIPWGSDIFWILLIMVFTILVLLQGSYQRIEGLSVGMVSLFTLTTVIAAIVLTRKNQYFSLIDLSKGFSFNLSQEGLVTSLAVFGITGVGATELFAYPYWCLEKGYNRFIGQDTEDPHWCTHVKGWLKVMHIDIYVSIIIYTLATLAFYLLGAGILHGMGLIPDQGDMVIVLSNLYTQTLGSWAQWLFFLGALATMYSTIFSASAAHSRMYADMAQLIGCYHPDDDRKRKTYTQGFLLMLTLVPVFLFFLFQAPVWMVIAGGVAQSVLLPVVAFATFFLTRKIHNPELRPTRMILYMLFFASLLITTMVGISVIIDLIRRFS